VDLSVRALDQSWLSMVSESDLSVIILALKAIGMLGTVPLVLVTLSESVRWRPFEGILAVRSRCIPRRANSSVDIPPVSNLVAHIVQSMTHHSFPDCHGYLSQNSSATLLHTLHPRSSVSHTEGNPCPVWHGSTVYPKILVHPYVSWAPDWWVGLWTTLFPHCCSRQQIYSGWWWVSWNHLLSRGVALWRPLEEVWDGLGWYAVLGLFLSRFREWV